VIVVEHLDLKAGLVVDRLMGELQTVIKFLAMSRTSVVRPSSAAAKWALIIDVPTLLKQQEPTAVSG
jgi:two-component system, chemotaxis family, sensor kinase CheA